MHRYTSTIVLSLFAALAPGCKSSEPGPDAPAQPALDSAHALAKNTPSEPVALEPGASKPAANAAETVDDGFKKLLAGLGVTYLRTEKCLEVHGWVNMQKGLVEVFACAPRGKTHEAVIVLDCVPSGLHAGLLALGLVAGKPVEVGTSGEYKPPTGDLVDVLVRWETSDGKTHEARAEDWVWNEKERAPMKQGPWIFAGSFMQPVPGSTNEATYAADYNKSLVTTYHDAASILENPLTEGADDTVYYSNEHAVPAAGTPLTVVFRAAAKAPR